MIEEKQNKLQFSSAAQLSPTLCDPMDCGIPGLPVHHWLPEITKTHVHQIGDAIQPSHPLSFPSPPALNLSQHQGLFQWVNSLHKVAKVLEFQLHHQSFQWIFRTDFLIPCFIRTRPSFPYSQSLLRGNSHKPLILVHQRADRMKTTIIEN